MTGSQASADLWRPTPEAARARLSAVEPAGYARTRNHLDGAVTGLSPYITHGMLSLPEVLAQLLQAHRLSPQHKLVFELGWREFFRHAWRHDGDAIFSSLHPGPLPDAAYARELPADIREARTGLAVVDEAVHTLYSTGYLHNHARMWLASYVVHLRKVHWRAGADWMVAHLLDGDLASNHLSWQWVAGTASHKPYLFNAENVRRYAPASWHVDGSALDTSYAALDEIARDARRIVEPRGRIGGTEEPTTRSEPPETAGFRAPDAGAVAGKAVWVVHPWCLRDPPQGTVPVAILDRHFHARWPWSERRWQFVTQRMQQITPHRWLSVSDTVSDTITRALASAASVQGIGDPHLGPLGVALRLPPPEAIWPEPGRRQRSFSAWWNRVSRRVSD